MLDVTSIDQAFEMGTIRYPTLEGMKKYMRYTNNFRLVQLGPNPIDKIGSHPLGYVQTQLNTVERFPT